MTSSNVSNLLVQVKQIDVTVNADKAAAGNAAGLFEKTLKNVADNVPKAESNTDSSAKMAVNEQNDSKSSPVTAVSQKKEIATDDKISEEAVSEEVVEKVEEVIEQVVDVIEKELDVTEDDIKLAMENLGLTFIDLLNPQSLSQVVAELTGETDSISLILDDQFAGILEKVTEVTNQLFDGNVQSFVEVKELYEAAMTVTEENNVVLEEYVPETVEIQESKQPETIVNEKPEVTVVTVENKKDEIPEKLEKSAEKTVDDTLQVKEEPKVMPKQENKDTFDEDQPEKNDFPKDQKVDKEPIVRHDNTVPVIQNEAPQFIPENKTVYLPTGETVQAEDIAKQLVEQARILTDTESTTMELTLNPEGLGKIFLEVTQKGNEITAKIFTENDAVKTALESQMANLRTEMNQSSAKVTSIEVSVGTHEFEKNLEDNQRNDSRREEQSREQSSKRSNRIDLNSLDGLTGMMSEEDILIAQMMQDNGGTLDFMA